jgi:NhaP-type Na+/H+ and K+/H+ antiporter
MTGHACFDFVVHGAAPLASLARVYGLEPDAVHEGRSAGDLLARAFGDTIRVGDRTAWGPVDLVVRSLRGEGEVDTVGLALDPGRPAQLQA